jgi:methyl-accepting chemotaxis protein
MEAGTEQVEQGLKTTERTGESLREIIGMNDRVSDMINQIAATTAEQSSTSEEVSRNVGEIARLAQESANGAVEAAKACDELSAMAIELEKIFRQFTLRDSRPNRPPTSRPAPPMPVLNGELRAARLISDGRISHGAAAGSNRR